MFALYSFSLALALILYFPYYGLRTKFFRKEKLFLRQRLGQGLPDGDPSRPTIWIHAVSVGEVLSLQSLVKKIRQRHPDWQIHFSALTNTGYRMAMEKLQDADHVFFVPLDFGWVVRRFFQALKPHLLVLAESEFWPNLLREAKRSDVCVLLINGRVSQRSYGRFRRLKPAVSKLLQPVDAFLVQTDLDRERLIAVGIDPARVEKAGNLKCEVDLPEMTGESVRELKKNLGIGETRAIITAGSTRNGEEEQLLKAFLEARTGRDDPLFILAPRHIQRCSEVERLCAGLGLSVVRRTEASWAHPAGDVLLLDTMGELARIYSLSDATFIGGSLVPWGGQNLLEPAYYQKPIFFGPHMENFSFLADEFLRAGGARVVGSKKDLVEMFRLKDRDGLAEMGKRARAVLGSLQGATEKTIRTIERMMEAQRVG